MNAKQQMLKEMYEEGVPVKEIAQVLSLAESSVSTMITRLRQNGKLEKRRTKTTARRCEFTPGKACLECPYSDCIASGKRLSQEEKNILDCGVTKIKQKESEKECWN